LRTARSCQRDPIDDETRAIGDPVVKTLRAMIRLVRMPVQAGGFATSSIFANPTNECLSNPAPASVLADKEILQIADICCRRCASVKKMVRDADGFAGMAGN
jgi:hypothetical protein